LWPVWLSSSCSGPLVRLDRTPPTHRPATGQIPRAAARCSWLPRSRPALLVGGCAGQAADSTAGTAPGTTASTLPTTTTVPPLTSGEVAWLDALTNMRETFEKNPSRQGAPGGDWRRVAGAGGPARKDRRRLRAGPDSGRTAAQRSPAAGLCTGQEGVSAVRQGGALSRHGGTTQPAELQVENG
jgi:hypothetical protein